MNSINNIAIILQARTGSTRLPNKMLLPFFNGKTILEIIVLNLLNYFSANQIIIATTVSNNDDELELIANELGVNCFRGDEQNVLDRFIKAADYYKANKLIRVCADNPLLQASYVKQLAESFLNKPDNIDYLSFAFPDGTPVIKSHIGLFAEATTISALKKVQKLTTEKLYCEHVTNYFYANTSVFNVDFLELPTVLQNRKDIRLTIDTREDFETMQDIVSKNCSKNNYEISIPEILNYLDKNTHLLKSMANEIERNSK